jgi:hypothetical protein
MRKSHFTYDIEKHEQFFYKQLSEKDKRLYAGLEAMKIGYYGVESVSKKYSLSQHTVRRGKKELINESLSPEGYIRQKGGGRKKRFKLSN